MDFKEIASSLGLDKDDLIELLEIFLTTSFADIEKIETGLKENNAEKVARAAHSIKGASANLGFHEISSRSRDVEMAARDGSLAGINKYTDNILKELKKVENGAKMI